MGKFLTLGFSKVMPVRRILFHGALPLAYVRCPGTGLCGSPTLQGEWRVLLIYLLAL